MSSTALNRSSSPSLQSVTDLSDIDATSPVATAASNSGNLVVRPSALDVIDGHVKPAPAVASAPESACEATHELLESVQVARLEALGAKHGRYFFQSDFLAFLVEGTLYRVHGFLLTMTSPYWAQEVARGNRDGNPTRLDNVSVKEMDAFLSTLYPTDVEVAPRTFADWSAVLRLATMWQFEDKRQLAIVALEPIASPLQQLVLARAHDVEAWIHPAFVALCARTSTLNLEEAAQLSLQDVLHITSAREALYKGRVDLPSQKDISIYVANYMSGSTSPIPPAPRPVSTQSTVYTSSKKKKAQRSAAPATLQLSEPPTIEEKRTFVALLSTRNFSKVIEVAQPHNLKALCDLLFNFSDVTSQSGWGNDYRSLVVEIVLRSAFNCPFIPIGTQLLKSVTLALPNAEPDGKESRAMSSYGKFTQTHAMLRIKSCFDDAHRFWSSMDEALVKYEDFSLAAAHVASHVNCESVQFKALFKLSGPPRPSEQANYEEGSANLRTFFAALAVAGLLEEK
ncbi:hypothetical protein PENSPDRAFT_622391 [Peniophora sp. CONT]|nr:hypothetical protein PENSPDRAFT_622391 [Peniophora sp. CONT]